MNYETLDKIVPPAVSLIFFGVAAAAVVLSFVLDHHWRQYSTEPWIARRTRYVYLTVTGFLVAIMILTLPLIF